MNKKEQYLDQIKGILDQASRDAELQKSEYIELCCDVMETSGDRADATEVEDDSDEDTEEGEDD